MKIIQIIPRLNEGGVERGTVESSRIYVQQDHQNCVISAGGKLVETLTQQGSQHIQIDVATKNPFTFFSRAWRLRKALKAIQPDVVHIRSRVPGWLFKFANRTLHIPAVATLHGLNSVSRYSQIMVDFDRVICVSQQGVDYIRQNYQIPLEKIRLIPRGVDPTTFDPETLDRGFQKDFSDRYQLAGKVVLTMVGRISALKGCEVLIKAAAQLPKTIDWVMLIVGGPQKGQETYVQSLHDLVSQLNLQSRIHFTGSQRAVPEIYDLSTIVFSCNTHKPEAFGRSVAEAISMNRPVIAAAHGGVLDIIQPGKTGILVPPSDEHALCQAIQHALTIPWTGLRQTILDRFVLSKMAGETLACYQEIIK